LDKLFTSSGGHSRQAALGSHSDAISELWRSIFAVSLRPIIDSRFPMSFRSHRHSRNLYRDQRRPCGPPSKPPRLERGGLGAAQRPVGRLHQARAVLARAVAHGGLRSSLSALASIVWVWVVCVSICNLQVW